MNIKAQLPLVALLLATGAAAGDHRYPLAPAYVAECGSCHVAYPPALLSAADWATTMQNLDRHFGSDASLDPEVHKAIAAILQAQASTRSKHTAGGTAPRLTATLWFQKEHRAEKLRRHQAQPAPATPQSTPLAQCNTCHARADQGDFGENSLKTSATRR